MSVTIPAGTAQSAGFTQDMSFPARIVTQINVRIPPGPRGEVGFGIGSAGVIVIPYGGTDYIVTDDEDLVFPLTNAVESGSWTFFGYNTGAYPHTIQVYFSCDPIPLPILAGSGPLPITAPPSGTPGSSGTPGTPGTGCYDDQGNPIPCPPGVTGVPPGSPGGSVPPPTVPPIPPPTVPPIPVTIPPILTGPPGYGAGASYDQNDPILIALSDLGQVWLLDEDSYIQLTAQPDADALLNAGLTGVQVSDELSSGIISAQLPNVSVSLGTDVLSGKLTYSSQGGTSGQSATGHRT